MPQRLAINVYGQVQGVFYRHTARQKAAALGLSGFARNEPDGSVYIEAEGEKASITEFIAWCRQGTPAARVERITRETIPLQNDGNFRII